MSGKSISLACRSAWNYKHRNFPRFQYTRICAWNSYVISSYLGDFQVIDTYFRWIMTTAIAWGEILLIIFYIHLMKSYRGHSVDWTASFSHWRTDIKNPFLCQILWKGSYTRLIDSLLAVTFFFLGSQQENLWLKIFREVIKNK
jgi:hypothetical protein